MERTKQKTGVFARTRSAYSTLASHRYTTIAGTLVFFLVTSLVPLLFFLTLLAGNAGISSDELFGLELFDWAEDLLLYLATHAERASAGANVFFIATTLWSATGFFYHLKRSGEIVYGAAFEKGYRVRIRAVFCALLMLLFALLTAGILFGADLATRSLPLWASHITVYLLAVLSAFFAAWILQSYACPFKPSPARTVLGSVFTTLGWLASSLIFAVYLRFSNRERLYGAFSTVIVFLLFLYWLMICFTAGVVVNCRVGERRSETNPKRKRSGASC